MKKKIKVLHILNLVGGVEICFRQICENIDTSIIETSIVCQKLVNKSKLVTSKGEEIISFSIPIAREINPIFDLFSIIKLIFIINKTKPDVIHAHSAKAGVIARIASFFFKIKVLYTPHAFSYLSANSKFKRFLFLIVEKILRTKNTIVLATSNSEKNQAIHTVGFDQKKVFVLENAIDTNTIGEDKDLEKTLKDKTYICTVGRPSFQKNLEMLIKAFEAVAQNNSKVHLFIIGAGEYSPRKDKIIQMINKRNLNNRVTILPWISRKQVQTYIKNAKLYVSSSRYEGMPYSVIESMALSRPSVLTNTDGNRDLVIDKKSGFLVEVGDDLEMANKIITLLNDNKLRNSFALQAKKLFIKNHLLSDYLQKLTVHYQKTIKK
jgi:glycosyltransferase involved in cell wall biosynthesis